jgi:hypothetical protein
MRWIWPLSPCSKGSYPGTGRAPTFAPLLSKLEWRPLDLEVLVAIVLFCVAVAILGFSLSWSAMSAREIGRKRVVRLVVLVAVVVDGFSC